MQYSAVWWLILPAGLVSLFPFLRLPSSCFLLSFSMLYLLFLCARVVSKLSWHSFLFMIVASFLTMLILDNARVFTRHANGGDCLPGWPRMLQAGPFQQWLPVTTSIYHRVKDQTHEMAVFSMVDPRWSSSSAQCGAAARDVTKGSRRRQESEWWSWA